MPGGLGRNLRKGHLAEDLGILMLRSFCAIAHVRQEDDFGVDGVATLLNLDKGFLHAGETFLVQIKAASVSRIELSERDVAWMDKQRLPLFFCSVNLNDSSMKIYSSGNFYYAVQKMRRGGEIKWPESKPKKDQNILALDLGKSTDFDCYNTTELRCHESKKGCQN